VPDLSLLFAIPPYVALAIGLVLLTFGGDTLVRGATSAAKALGVSPLLIGLTLVGFGTSTPELVTSLQAAIQGSPGIAVGNVVGSNVANILLILGITALIFPIAADPKAYKRDGWALALATLAAVAVCLYGRLDPVVGGVFVAFLLGYVVLCYLQERKGDDGAEEKARHEAEAAEFASEKPNLWLALLLAAAGILLTIFGARYLVNGAVVIARDYGISETVIGLTVVAVGTSLPELVTSVIAALKKQSAVALGNIVGSNIYNIAFILGVTALVKPIEVPPEIARLDAWIMLAATALLLATVRSGWRISRREGLLLLALYVGYTGWLAWSAGAISI
jgi:cation:H+ antiporter